MDEHPPEKSPLEDMGNFARRLKKWRLDTAKWEGQRKAIDKFDPLPVVQIPKEPWKTGQGV